MVEFTSEPARELTPEERIAELEQALEQVRDRYQTTVRTIKAALGDDQRSKGGGYPEQELAKDIERIRAERDNLARECELTREARDRAEALVR